MTKKAHLSFTLARSLKSSVNSSLYKIGDRLIIPFLPSRPSFPGHHGHELVKVHGAAVVLVDLLDDLVEVVLAQGGVDLAENLLQHVRRDVPVAWMCSGIQVK